jgi:hypothetical protein
MNLPVQLLCANKNFKIESNRETKNKRAAHVIMIITEIRRTHPSRT